MGKKGGNIGVPANCFTGGVGMGLTTALSHSNYELIPINSLGLAITNFCKGEAFKFALASGREPDADR